MATLEEIIRKRKETEGKENTTTLERILVERNLRTHGNNSKAIKGYNDWVGRVNASRDKYVEDAKSRADVYQPSNLFNSYADTTDAEIKALAQEGQKYREHFLKYGDLYGADMANKIRSGVDDVDSYLHDLSVGLGAERRYWEGFTDLEDFNTKRAAAEAAKKEAEEYAKKKEEYGKYDSQKGQSEIDNLQVAVDRMTQIQKEITATYNGIQAGGRGYANEQKRAELQAELSDLESKYGGTLSELSAVLSDKRAYHEGAQQFLDLDKFSNYGNPRSEYYDPNFEKWAAEGAKSNTVSDTGVDALDYMNLLLNGGGDYSTSAQYLTEDQRKNYNYLWYKDQAEGTNTAQQYLDYISKETLSNATYGFGSEHPFLASLMSVPTSLASGIEFVGDSLGYLGNAIFDPYNAKMDSNGLAETTSTLRQGVSDTVDWNIGGWDAFDFLYNTGMSGVDSAVASFIPGGYMLLGLSAAANGVNDGLERGMSDGQALANGVFSGIFEAVFEKISIGNLDSMKSLTPKTLKQFGKEMVKSMGVNASEEALTELANITYDIIANGELSQLQQLVGSGKSYLEAIGELGLQVLESGASGALMGFGFSGAAAGVNSAVNTFKQNNIGKGIVADGKAQDYISRGLELPDTKAFKYAEAAKAKLDKGKSANVRIGKLAQNLSDSQMISSFRSQLGEKSGDIAETLTDLVKGREVSNKAIRSILQNETALSMLNESFGTSFTADSKVEDVNEGIKKGFETPKTERDKIVDTLKKNVDSKGVNAYADTIEALQRGEVVSDKEINAFLKNPQALAALNEITGETLTKKSTTNTVRKAMVKDNMSRPGQALMFGTTLDIGENGLKGLVSVANHSSGSMANIAQAYNAIYQAAKQGKAITDAKNPYLAELNAAQKLMAYESGVMDSLEKKTSGEVLQNDKKDAKINSNKESGENEQGIRLREGGERNDGENTNGQVSSVEGGATETEEQRSGSNQEERSASIRAFVKAEGLSKVSSKSIGISAGTDTKNIVGLPESVYDEGMRQIVEEQAAQGRKVIFVSGAMEIVENGEIIEARGVISTDGKTIWIQADDATVLPEQIALHEEFHAKAKADPSLIARMKKKVKEKYKGKLELLTEVYANLYFTDDKGKRAVSDDYIIEEILSDAYAGIDVLETISDAAVRATEFSEDIREGAKNIESARAPPSSGEVKASRNSAERNRALRKGEMVNQFRNKVNWTEYYEAIKAKEYSPDLYDDGDTAILCLKGQTLILEMQTNGEFSVIGIKEVANHGQNEIKNRDNRIESGKFDSDNGRAQLSGMRNRHGDRSDRHSHRSDESSRAGRKSDTGELRSQSNNKGNATNNSRSVPKYTAEEIDAILIPLKKKYGVDDAGIKASRSLKSPQDVARAYLDAVPNRLILANALESVAESDRDKAFLDKYKARLAQIDKDTAEIARLKEEKKGAEKLRREVIASKIEKLENGITESEKWLKNLEDTATLKRLVNKERDAMYAEAVLAGQMAQGKLDARVIRKQQEKLKEYQEARERSIQGRNKTEIRNKIKGVVSKLHKLLTSDSKEKHVPSGLRSVVADALSMINMDTLDAEKRIEIYNERIANAEDPVVKEALTHTRDEIEAKGVRFAEKIAKLQDAYAQIKKDASADVRSVYSEDIEEYIKAVREQVGDTSIKDMDIDQLEAVYEMFKIILKNVRDGNKLFLEGIKKTIAENSMDVSLELAEVRKNNKALTKVGKMLKKFGWSLLKPVTAMKVIGSKTFAKLYENIRKGEDTWAVDIKESADFFEKIRNKYKFDSWNLEKRHDFIDDVGNKFSLTVEQIMSLYAYSKRDKADLHLEKGGFVFDSNITVKEKNKLGIPVEYYVNDTNPYRLNKEKVAEISSTLTKEQIDFVDEMQAYLSDVMGEKGNEVSMKLYDVRLFKEKNYFPLKTSKYFREFNPEKAGTPKIKNSGFTHKTLPGASNPIVLSNFTDVWTGHINDMAMYHAFTLPVEDFMRVYNYNSREDGFSAIKQKISEHYGDEANNYIQTLIDQLNGGARSDPDADMLSRGIAKFKKAKTFVSASVVIQQPSALARAWAYIDPKYFVDKPQATSHDKTWAEVKKYAPVAIIKEMGRFDANMGRSTADYIMKRSYKTIKEKAKGIFTDKEYRDDVLSKAPALADELAWCAIWKAVKREVSATTNIEVNSAEYFKRCGERFTEIIENTQVYDSVLAKSEIMRSKDSGLKMATAFASEPLTTVNMMVDAVIEGGRGRKNFARKTLGAVMTSVVLNSILVSIVYAARDDDEDETYSEKYLASLTSELIDGFNPLTYIPIVRDAWSAMQGYDIERTDMSMFGDLWKSVEGLFSTSKGGFDKVSDFVGNVAALFGIPADNIMRDARAIYNVGDLIYNKFANDLSTTKWGVRDAVAEAVKNVVPLWNKIETFTGNKRTKYDEIYEALVSGDETYIKRAKSHFKPEELESGIKRGLRDNDIRVKEAAEAYLAGNVRRFGEIIDTIAAEGVFEAELIESTVRSEINRLKPDEEKEETVEAATSIYKASDINVAFDSGDNEQALEVLAELIEVKTINNVEKLRKEAEKKGKTISEIELLANAEFDALSSIRSSITSYWKPRYILASEDGNSEEMDRIYNILLSTDLYGKWNKLEKTLRNWLEE